MVTTTGLDSGSGGDGATVDGYCAVTVVCGDRRLDVALPSGLPWADLEPSVLRLLFADQPSAAAGRWVLTPIGRADLDPSETLAGAGVLPADVLHLRQPSVDAAMPALARNVRDRVEDVVDERDQFWGRPESRRLVLWTAILVGALLLTIAAAGPWLTGGLRLAGLSATVALMVALTTVVAARNQEMICAAVGLVVGCGCAAVAGGACLIR